MWAVFFFDVWEQSSLAISVLFVNACVSRPVFPGPGNVLSALEAKNMMVGTSHSPRLHPGVASTSSEHRRSTVSWERCTRPKWMFRQDGSWEPLKSSCVVIPKSGAAYGIGFTLRHVTPARVLCGNLRLPRGNWLKAGS